MVHHSSPKEYFRDKFWTDAAQHDTTGKYYNAVDNSPNQSGCNWLDRLSTAKRKLFPWQGFGFKSHAMERAEKSIMIKKIRQYRGPLGLFQIRLLGSWEFAIFFSLSALFSSGPGESSAACNTEAPGLFDDPLNHWAAHFEASQLKFKRRDREKRKDGEVGEMNETMLLVRPWTLLLYWAPDVSCIFFLEECIVLCTETMRLN